MKPRHVMNAGRRWAYGGSALGVALSVAANVEHVLVQSDETAPGAVVSAAACPVILLVALEIIARTRWPLGLRWLLLRWLALPTVAVVAASISYLHMRSLLIAYGESPWAATVGPLAVDGLMAVAVGALLVPLEESATESLAAPLTPPSRGAEPTTSGDAPTPRRQATVLEPPASSGGSAPVAAAPEAPARRRRTTSAGSGDVARSALLDALVMGAARQADLVRATGLPRRTVRDHLAILLSEGAVTREGQVFSAARRGADDAHASRADEDVALNTEVDHEDDDLQPAGAR